MPDHVHALPVCGFGGHNPHDPSCANAGLGREWACGEVVDPANPNFGQALCRHDSPPAAAAPIDVHYHEMPECGSAPHKPHDPSCAARGPMIGCGKIADPMDPHFGQAICKHRRGRRLGCGCAVLVLAIIAALLALFRFLGWDTLSRNLSELLDRLRRLMGG